MAENDVTEAPDTAPTGAGNGGDGGGPSEPGAAGGGGGSPGQPQNEILSLAQLIGSPIHALVDAEAQSAMATARFIRTVGFKPPDAGEPGNLGDLQMAEFRRARRGPDGEVQEDEIQIPLLTLVPIPMLQIRDAELEYYVKVIQTEALPPPREDDVRKLPIEDRIAPERLATVRATFTGEPRPGARRSMDMLLKMKVRMEQADMPNGLSKLLNLAGEMVGRKPEHDGGKTEGQEQTGGSRKGGKGRKGKG